MKSRTLLFFISIVVFQLNVHAQSENNPDVNVEKLEIEKNNGNELTIQKEPFRVKHKRDQLSLEERRAKRRLLMESTKDRKKSKKASHSEKIQELRKVDLVVFDEALASEKINEKRALQRKAQIAQFTNRQKQ